MMFFIQCGAASQNTMIGLLARSLAFVSVPHPSPLQLGLGILVHWTVAFHVHVPSITVNQQHRNI